MGRLSYRGVTVAILLFGAALIAVIYVWLPERGAGVDKVDPEADERARRERAARVCEETRARVVRGAVVGVTDVEGWLLELVLLRPAGGEPMVPNRDLNEVVKAGGPGEPARFVWKEAPQLAAIEGGVVASDVTLNTGAETARPGIRLTFDGGYVTSYFREEERPPWISAASALARRLGATHGALYARCATGSSHHLGSWFLGPEPDGAASALLYFMGTYADVPHVRRALLEPEGGTGLDRGYAFEQLGAATRSLDRSRLRMSIGPHGGMISGTKGSLSLTFPFRDADRAARASRDLALALGIGVER